MNISPISAPKEKLQAKLTKSSEIQQLKELFKGEKAGKRAYGP